MNNGKKFRRSGFSIACYVIAAVMLVYVCYLVGTTVSTINQYYAQYDMTAQPGEYVSYIMQQALTPLVNTVVVFMLGYILDAVRKNNPDNYMTDEEVEEARIAKKEAREAKKYAKGEAAAAKAGVAASTEKSVEADFAKSLDEELKADEAKAEKKPAANRNRNRNYQKKPAGAKTTTAKKKTDGQGGGSKSNSGKGSGNNRRSNSRKAETADSEAGAKESKE